MALRALGRLLAGGGNGRGGGRFALRGEHDAGPPKIFRPELRNLENGLVRAHLAGLVFAHQHLQAILAGRELESGFVEQVFRFESTGLLVAQADLDVVAQHGDLRVFRVADLAQEVEAGHLLRRALLAQRDFRAGDFYGHRDKPVIAAIAEPVDLDRQRERGGRVAEQHGVLQLFLATLRAHGLELGVGVVARAVVQAGGNLRVQFHVDLAILAVAPVVGRVEAEHVVAAQVVLGQIDAFAQVVVVDRRLAAGLRSDRNQRVLRAGEAVALSILLAAVEHARAAHRGRGSVPAGHQGLQSPHVHRVD